jgi:hypothetical protein
VRTSRRSSPPSRSWPSAQDDLPEQQLAVLKCWLLGNDFNDIAAEVKLSSPDEAKKLLRAGLARLRRKLADNGTT